jgi:hypothetical protein
MKFIYKDNNNIKLTFGQVEEDQFFIDKAGRFCQKTGPESYHSIADVNGKPYACTFDLDVDDKPIDDDTPISAKLNLVEKIEF